MNKQILLLTVTALIMIGVLSACNSCKSEHTSTIEESVSFEEINLEDAIEEVYYSLPSPEELMEYVKSNDIKYNADLLLNKKYAMSAQVPLKRNLLLGAYMSDIAYLSLFSQTNELPGYLHNAKYLASELGLYAGLVKDNEQLLTDLVQNPSALKSESSSIYGDVINFVQNNDNGNTLALIATGAYIESLYLMIELHPQINKHQQAIERIIEQKILLSDVLAMLKQANVESNEFVYQSLLELNELFAHFEIKSSIENVVKNEDGSIQIVNTSQIKLSADYYEQLKAYIISCRTNLLKNE
jgi:hypothetical protein